MGYVWWWILRRRMEPSLFGKFVIVTFVLVQCLDGIFTYMGVNAWGLNVEANSLIGWTMSAMGVGLGLMVVKLVAVGFGAFIYWSGSHNLLALLTAVYVTVAILPWTYLLLVI